MSSTNPSWPKTRRIAAQAPGPQGLGARSCGCADGGTRGDAIAGSRVADSSPMTAGRKKPRGGRQVLLATRGPTEGLSCFSRDGFLQPCTFVAVKFEKSPGFSERDVVFASEVAQLVVLGLRRRCPADAEFDRPADRRSTSPTTFPPKRIVCLTMRPLKACIGSASGTASSASSAVACVLATAGAATRAARATMTRSLLSECSITILLRGGRLSNALAVRRCTAFPFPSMIGFTHVPTPGGPSRHPAARPEHRGDTAPQPWQRGRSGFM
jgi:hypothetical protein